MVKSHETFRHWKMTYYTDYGKVSANLTTYPRNYRGIYTPDCSLLYMYMYTKVASWSVYVYVPFCPEEPTEACWRAVWHSFQTRGIMQYKYHMAQYPFTQGNNIEYNLYMYIYTCSVTLYCASDMDLSSSPTQSTQKQFLAWKVTQVSRHITEA